MYWTQFHAVATVRSSMDDKLKELECPVCMELLKVPKSLECGHSVCMGCLQSLVSNSCPTCRKAFSRPRNSYPTNFQLQSAVEILEKVFVSDQTTRLSSTASSAAETLRALAGETRQHTTDLKTALNRKVKKEMEALRSKEKESLQLIDQAERSFVAALEDGYKELKDASEKASSAPDSSSVKLLRDAIAKWTGIELELGQISSSWSFPSTPLFVASSSVISRGNSPASKSQGTLIVNAALLEDNGAFASLQQAVQAANDGDTIQVYPFKYQEHSAIEVSKALVIEGVGPQEGNVVTLHSGLVLTGRGGVLKNLTIVGESGDSVPSLVRISKGGWTFTDCTISATKQSNSSATSVAIAVEAGSCTLTNCVVNGADGVGLDIISVREPLDGVSIKVTGCKISGKVGVQQISKRAVAYQFEGSSITSASFGVRIFMAPNKAGKKEKALFSNCEILAKDGGVGIIIAGSGLFRINTCTIMTHYVNEVSYASLLAIGRGLTGVCENSTFTTRNSELSNSFVIDAPAVTFQNMKMNQERKENFSESDWTSRYFK